MRPILLSGHERSLTQVKFNREGDLLFSTAKDHVVNAWFSHNGERLGTYDGHKGTVWTMDVDSQSKYLVTGAADNSLKLWEVATGELLYSWEFPTAVKRVAWSEDDSQVLAVTVARMGHRGTVKVFAINRDEPQNQSPEPLRTITFSGSQATVAAFSALDTHIITGHEDGKVSLFYHDPKEPESGVDVELEERSNEDGHAGSAITDLQMSLDRTYFVTSSKDKSAKLFDSKDLSVIKTFATETPLNSASIHPTKPYVIVGGGQEAMNVTTTSARQGKFETRFWHKVFEEECARLPGHFGPINTIAIHPAGKAFATGGEDGYVRVNHFDDSFFRSRPYGADLELAGEDQ